MKKMAGVLLVLSLCSLWLGSCIAAEKGLIAYWSFDEGKGSVAKDQSGNGFNLELAD